MTHRVLTRACCAVLCREGNLIWPVLLDHVTPDMRIAWEEPFGPVLPILRVPDAAAAVQHCNSSNLGLQGCVFTRDINTAMRISDAMQTGTVQVCLCGLLKGFHTRVSLQSTLVTACVLFPVWSAPGTELWTGVVLGCCCWQQLLVACKERDSMLPGACLRS